MREWEYKVVFRIGKTTEIIEARLNELGIQCWEVVNIDSRELGYAYFKRRVKDRLEA